MNPEDVIYPSANWIDGKWHCSYCREEIEDEPELKCNGCKFKFLFKSWPVPEEQTTTSGALVVKSGPVL